MTWHSHFKFRIFWKCIRMIWIYDESIGTIYTFVSRVWSCRSPPDLRAQERPNDRDEQEWRIVKQLSPLTRFRERTKIHRKRENLLGRGTPDEWILVNISLSSKISSYHSIFSKYHQKNFEKLGQNGKIFDWNFEKFCRFWT